MSMRVRAAPADGEVRRGGPGGVPVDDSYMSRLVKLVPAEAVGPYPFLMQQANTLTPDGSGPRYAVYFIAWLLLLVVIIVRWKTTSEPGKGAQWGAVLIAAVAFFIWVHVMNGDFGFELLLNKVQAGVTPDGVTRGDVGTMTATSLDNIKQFVSNTMLMVWTTLAPVVYRGDDSH